MKTVLIYAFEPFLQYRVNITEQLVRALPAYPGVETRILPVRFEADLFLAPLRASQPDYLLGLGQCPRGRQIRIERKAWNQMRPDRQSELEVIAPGQPASLAVTWKLPVWPGSRLSYDAGRYVCNYAMFVLSDYARRHDLPYAFAHIPRDYSLRQAHQWLERMMSHCQA